jgi:isoprenylcysteine carboxyl methyltransferase (ICMT) family protein YpbQ
MSTIIGLVFFTFLFLRLLTTFISARNEKKLKKLNAVEFGKSNSMWLVIAHTLYYAAAMIEGFVKGAFFTDRVSYVGLLLYIFSILALYYVIYSIRHVWTVKLFIAPKNYHAINSNFLFKHIRHPNYFLNIIPELIGIALLFHAWFTLTIGLTLYLIPLTIRISQEEKVMKEHFETY